MKPFLAIARVVFALAQGPAVDHIGTHDEFALFAFVFFGFRFDRNHFQTVIVQHLTDAPVEAVADILAVHHRIDTDLGHAVTVHKIVSQSVDGAQGLGQDVTAAGNGDVKGITDKLLTDHPEDTFDWHREIDTGLLVRER